MNKMEIITPQQKLIAGLLFALGLGILYFLLPPFIAIMENLWLALFYVVPLLVVAFFHQQIWDKLNIWSFNMTRDMISKNPTFFLERGYNYIVGQIDEMREHLVNSSAIIKETESTVKKYISDIDSNQNSYEKSSDESIKRIIAAKIATLQNTIDSILPSIDLAKKQKAEMEIVLDNYSADGEILRHKIDSLNTQYELLGQLSKMADKGRKLLNGNSKEVQDFKESIKITEREMFKFTSNIESFQKEVFTYSSMKSLENEENQQKGLEIIEQYKQKRLQLAK